MKFNERLKFLRLEKGMTQEELAQKLNISRQSVSKWENGINEPGIETIKEICRVFGISVNALIEDDSDFIISKEQRIIKQSKFLFKLVLAFCLFDTLVTITYLRFLPARIPMHFDMNFNVNRYGSKYELLAIIAITYVMVFINYYIYKKTIKERSDEYLRVLKMLPIMNIVFIAIMLSIVSLVSFKSFIDIKRDIVSLLSLIMIIIFMILSIFSFPVFNKKRNVFFGFRTLFTLRNDEAWIKVNRFQAYSALVVTSITYIIGMIFAKEWTLYLTVSLIVSVIPTFIYHEVLRKRITK
ncbi:MAG: helix-turn-helix domain-containing protein [Acholeplasma sp.]|nr:helix-turn-helix domain-containing protein [Acholeplasma sp.]